jgi:transposase
MGARQCSADRLLGLYKDQALSERAHHFLKGPLAVRPVFLKSNRRAAALVQVCSIALLVYGLIEADVRAAIAPARTVAALLPEGRAARPTAANIFAAFTGLGYQRARTTDGLAYIPDALTLAQSAVLAALKIPSILPPQG